MNNCRACGTPSELRKSHIIPEWAFKPIYTKKHTFAPITADNQDQLRQEQKGYRERLLCQKCETYLSRLEKMLKATLADFATTDATNATNSVPPVNYCVAKVKEYNNFKRGVLSILWRMAVSNSPTFSKYSLGDDEEFVRKYVFDPSETLGWDQFPISVSRIVANQGQRIRLMLLFQPAESETPAMFQFALSGFVINIISRMSHEDMRQIQPVVLDESGTIPIVDVPFTELADLNPDLFRRIMDKDVEEFMRKNL